jgi:hypothetical protein
LVVAGILLAIFVVPAVLRARRRREPPPDTGIRVKFLHDDDRPRDR